ncbi:MAG: UDP-3-O-acylglucosamine N-acyltransferase [Chlamydiia bacterium]|nr:UDP-3-O-acylglucosamine N-acyltransferase [Chlamydiia bacterium]
MPNTFTLEELANQLNLEFSGDGKTLLSGVNSLDKAAENEVSFLSNEKYTSNLQTTNAAAVCVEKTTPLIEGKNYLVSDDSSRTFSMVTELLMEDNSPSGFKDIHPTAVIHQSAKIGKNVQIGPYVVIDKDVTIEDDCIIYSHVSIGPKSSLGKNCLIYSSVVIREDCHLGNNVILQPHVVIGGCGYGYDTCKKTGVHYKIKHFGKVIIEDDVEIGSCTTIDRGRFDKTIIRKGTKIDNHCMVAHNCDIGKQNLMVSMSGIAGSSTTGTQVTMAAQVGVVGHVKIANNVTLGARTAVIKSIKEPGLYFGAPAKRAKEAAFELICIKKLPSMMKKFKEAEKLLEAFKNQTTE